MKDRWGHRHGHPFLGRFSCRNRQRHESLHSSALCSTERQHPCASKIGRAGTLCSAPWCWDPSPQMMRNRYLSFNWAVHGLPFQPLTLTTGLNPQNLVYSVIGFTNHSFLYFIIHEHTQTQSPDSAPVPCCGFGQEISPLQYTEFSVK